MKKLIVAAVAALGFALAVALPANAAEAVITYKSLAPDAALTLAKAALDRCRKDGYQVSVVVLDRFGAPLVELRDRFAPVATLHFAKGKAWTAVTFTGDTSALIKQGSISAALAHQSNVTLVAGGLVIQSAGSLVGGVGVSGAPGGDKDEACAKAGLAAIQDKLDF
jgi:uncharacterized protein GlcG (DUF336 family)